MEAVEHIIIHATINPAFLVIPSEVYVEIKAAVSVFIDWIKLLDGYGEVFCMLAAHVFYDKVVHSKGECRGARHVMPEAGRVGYLKVPCWGKALFEELVGQRACLW